MPTTRTMQPLLLTALVGLSACAPTVSGKGFLFPWEDRPEHFQWMVSFGPSVAFFNDAPRGGTNLFFTLRLGVYLATAGEHHITESQADTSFIDYVGRRSYFRSGIPFLPDNVVVSPLRDATGMSVYGLTFRPTSIGLHPVGGLFRFGVSGGWVVSYLVIEHASQSTEFFQPGLDLRADLELDWGGDVFFTLGWNSLMHVPQAIANPTGTPTELWHLGQAFLLVNWRVPFGDTPPQTPAGTPRAAPTPAGSPQPRW